MDKQDAFAKGMVASGEEHFDLTPELDLFQYRMIKQFLGKDILEIGAGPGRIARLLLKDRVPYDSFVISEPSGHFFSQLTERVKSLGQCTLVQGETSDLAKRFPAAFDTIFSVHVLEHVENDKAFVDDCFTMLKPGGKLVTLVPALQFLYSDLDRNIGHYRRYDKKMVRALIGPTSFKLDKLYYTNFLAIFASLLFFKMQKIDYQSSQKKKSQFILLEKLYSRYAIPVIDLMERYLPMPLGLNLTFVVSKPDRH